MPLPLPQAELIAVASAVLKSSVLSDEFPECVYRRTRLATAGALTPLPLCCERATAESTSAPSLWIGDGLCPGGTVVPSRQGSVTTAHWLPIALWAEPPRPVCSAPCCFPPASFFRHCPHPPFPTSFDRHTHLFQFLNF